MKIALVHDWLVTFAGSERVVEQMLRVFPQADVFSLIDFMPAEKRGFLQGRPVQTSFLQRFPKAQSKYTAYLPLMPLAIEQFDLSRYDLVISSSHCVAKGVITGPDQLHVSYVHTPMRYAWDATHEYLASSNLKGGLRGWLTRWMLHKLRIWDARSANGVDSLVANSQFIARRIEKAYRRTARVIYPPVDTEAFRLGVKREDYYITASRLVPYKQVGVLVEAFRAMPDKRLIVIGDGSQAESLRRAAPPNVELVGYQSFDVLRSHFERAAAFLYAAQEDFGIVLAEAQASGCPVIAYGRGGAAEIVRGLNCGKPTGVLFGEQTPAAVVEAVRRFERQRGTIAPAACRESALRFTEERFRREFHAHVMTLWEAFERRRAGQMSDDAESLVRRVA